MPKKKPAVTRGDPRQRLIDAAFALAEGQGWRSTGLAAIAAEAELPLHEAYGLFRSKAAILAGFRRDIDKATLQGAGAGDAEGENARDRLFETLMHRFEALKPYRAGLRAMLRDSIGHPGALLVLPGLFRSMGWMLEAAGLPGAGLRGRLASRLLAGLYIAVFRVFLEDDSDDLGRTMAALDKRLRQAESVFGTAARFRRGGAKAA